MASNDTQEYLDTLLSNRHERAGVSWIGFADQTTHFDGAGLNAEIARVERCLFWRKVWALFNWRSKPRPALP